MKRKFCRSLTAALLCVLMLAPSFSSCAAPRSFTHTSFDYFDTVTVITGYGMSKSDFDSTSERITDMLEEYHRLFDIYNFYDGINNLASLNSLENGIHPTLTVDVRIMELLELCLDLYTKTDGALNVAMGGVLSIWHKYREEGKEIPPRELLEKAALHTDINSIIINKDGGTVHISDPSVTLDVGAVAKGFVAEAIADTLEAEGLTGYMLNLGGNIHTVGAKRENTPWVVGIEDPNKESAPIVTVNLDNGSLVTSGSYQRYYEVDGQKLHHIIDPSTLHPADRYLSVSVLTEDSALADGLSTALFCTDLESGLALVNAWDGVEAMWIDNDGDITYSAGFGRFLSKAS